METTYLKCCLECGEPIIDTKTSKKTFCSQACRKRFQKNAPYDIETEKGFEIFQMIVINARDVFDVDEQMQKYFPGQVIGNDK